MEILLNRNYTVFYISVISPKIFRAISSENTNLIQTSYANAKMKNVMDFLHMLNHNGGCDYMPVITIYNIVLNRDFTDEIKHITKV